MVRLAAVAGVTLAEVIVAAEGLPEAVGILAAVAGEKGAVAEVNNLTMYPNHEGNCWHLLQLLSLRKPVHRPGHMPCRAMWPQNLLERVLPWPVVHMRPEEQSVAVLMLHPCAGSHESSPAFIDAASCRQPYRLFPGM